MTLCLCVPPKNSNKHKTEMLMENKKKSLTWDIVLKVIIAVASAIAGALGVAACQ